jgi:hypothetical protein
VLISGKDVTLTGGRDITASIEVLCYTLLLIDLAVLVPQMFYQQRLILGLQ